MCSKKYLGAITKNVHKLHFSNLVFHNLRMIIFYNNIMIIIFIKFYNSVSFHHYVSTKIFKEYLFLEYLFVFVLSVLATEAATRGVL